MTKVHVGFLTVIECAGDGFVGGLLVLNHLGRPLEFHCSVPLRPNRAQEILYGPTLRPYLFGEQIGSTLIARAKQQAQVIFTDDHNVLDVSHRVDVPVLLVADQDDNLAVPAGWREIELLSTRTAIAAGQRSSHDEIAELMRGLDTSFDLREPFERIQAAISEAQKAA